MAVKLLSERSIFDEFIIGRFWIQRIFKFIIVVNLKLY